MVQTAGFAHEVWQFSRSKQPRSDWVFTANSPGSRPTPGHLWASPSGHRPCAPAVRISTLVHIQSVRCCLDKITIQSTKTRTTCSNQDPKYLSKTTIKARHLLPPFQRTQNSFRGNPQGSPRLLDASKDLELALQLLLRGVVTSASTGRLPDRRLRGRRTGRPVLPRS